MKILISYQQGSENKVDGPFLSHREVAAALDTIQAKGGKDATLHRIDMVCDFCSHPSITALFQITPGGVIGVAGGGVHIDRDGQWGTCEECEHLIRAQDQVNLLQRSVLNCLEFHPETKALPIEVVIEICAAPHAHFWMNYDGSESERVISDEELLNG